jgi:DNA-binding response OmpR family regulator
MKLLLIDDDPEITHIARIALERSGRFVVECCSSSEEAARVAPEFQPDVIVLDYLLEDGDGRQLLVRLRDHPGLEEVPVVFLTGKRGREDLGLLSTPGVRGVIEKPFDPLTLEAEVLQILGIADER